MISLQMVINYLDMKPGASSCSLARLRAAGLTVLCFFISFIGDTLMNHALHIKTLREQREEGRRRGCLLPKTTQLS